MMWKTSSSYKHRGKILSLLMTFKDSVWKKKSNIIMITLEFAGK